jgi:hypothetical protein
MRAFVITVIILIASGAYANGVSQWLRISSLDNGAKQIELCNANFSKCAPLGKKASYSLNELRTRQHQIRQIRNRTLAVKYAYAMLTFMVSPGLLATTSMIGGAEYGTYVVALQYMSEIEDAVETESLGSAQILVDSPAALNILRAALDAK